MLWSIALPAPRRGAKIFPGIAQALAPKSIPSFRADPESYLSSTDLPKPQRRISRSRLLASARMSRLSWSVFERSKATRAFIGIQNYVYIAMPQVREPYAPSAGSLSTNS